MIENCKVILTLNSLGKILLCDHSNETSFAAPSRGAIRFQYFTKEIFNFCQILNLSTSGSERVKKTLVECRYTVE